MYISGTERYENGGHNIGWQLMNDMFLYFQDVRSDNNSILLYPHLIFRLLLAKLPLSVVWSEIERDVSNGLKED